MNKDISAFFKREHRQVTKEKVAKAIREADQKHKEEIMASYRFDNEVLSFRVGK